MTRHIRLHISMLLTYYIEMVTKHNTPNIRDQHKRINNSSYLLSSLSLLATVAFTAAKSVFFVSNGSERAPAPQRHPSSAGHKNRRRRRRPRSSSFRRRVCFPIPTPRSSSVDCATSGALSDRCANRGAGRTVRAPRPRRSPAVPSGLFTAAFLASDRLPTAESQTAACG